MFPLDAKLAGLYDVAASLSRTRAAGARSTVRADPSGMTPEEIAGLIPPYKKSLLRLMYNHFADVSSDFPAAFRYATALTTLATCVPSDVAAPRNVSGFNLNFYALLIGSSGSRKSSTAVEGMKLIQAVDKKLYCSGIRSPEGFIKQAKKSAGRVCVYHSEFGYTLKQALTQASSVKTFITKCYDGEAISTETIGKGEMQLDMPRISSLACCNYAFLYGYSELDDWNGGMFSRFFIAHSRETIEASPHQDQPDLTRESAIITRLKELHEGIGVRCAGFEPEAWDIFNDLRAEVRQNNTGVGNDRFDAISLRIAMISVKIAMLYQIDAMLAGAFGGWFGAEKFRIDPWCMQMGVTAARLHWRESQWIARRVPISDDDRTRYRILEACSRLAPMFGGVTPLSLLVSPESNIGLIEHKLQKYLSSLVTEGVLKEERAAILGRAQSVYRLTDDDPFAGVMTSEAVQASLAAHAATLAELEE